jgi:hypothetical protein
VATCREEAEFYAREAMLDHLQLRYCAAAAALVTDGGGNETWRFLIAQASELCDDGREFGRRENVLRAIEIYHRALELVGREQSPLDWATTKHHLGDALLLLGKGDKETAPLREAVEAYLAALEEWTRDRAPLGWRRHKLISATHCNCSANRKVTRNSYARRPRPIARRSRPWKNDAAISLRPAGRPRTATLAMRSSRSRNAKTATLCWKRRPRPIAPRLRRELRVNAVEGLSIGIDRLLEMFAITFLNP